MVIFPLSVMKPAATPQNGSNVRNKILRLPVVIKIGEQCRGGKLIEVGHFWIPKKKARIEYWNTNSESLFLSRLDMFCLEVL